jgi:hypothetical protein
MAMAATVAATVAATCWHRKTTASIESERLAII